MRKLFLLQFILFSNFLFAQDNDTLPHKRGYFGIAVGAGFPLQTFLKKDFTNSKSGFANTGSNLQFNFLRNVYKNWGVIIRGNINTNPYDVNELAKSYNSANNKYNSINYTVNAKNWYCIGGMVGLNYTIPIHDFAVQIKGLIGYQYAESPQVRVTLSNGQDSSVIKQTSGFSNGFVWTLGTGASYQISNRISVAASIEYYVFVGTFTGSKTYIDNLEIANRDDFDMAIYTLNCSAALRYHF